MVVAVDVDGTLYDGVEVAPEAIRELRRARADGHTLVIVTGRRWEELGTSRRTSSHWPNGPSAKKAGFW